MACGHKDWSNKNAVQLQKWENELQRNMMMMRYAVNAMTFRSTFTSKAAATWTWLCKKWSGLSNMLRVYFKKMYVWKWLNTQTKTTHHAAGHIVRSNLPFLHPVLFRWSSPSEPHPTASAQNEIHNLLILRGFDMTDLVLDTACHHLICQR